MLQVALVSTNKASGNLSTLAFNVKPVLNRSTEDNYLGTVGLEILISVN